jgi:GNAT superfamily N-acetyltransferase
MCFAKMLIPDQRLTELFALHEKQLQKHTQHLSKRNVWYLEVVATDPSAQGKGVGGAFMRWVLEQIGQEPCFLECTDEKNVPFYEKYGFCLMETSTLMRDVDMLAVKVFWMVRSGS